MNRKWLETRRDVWIDAVLTRTALPLLLGALLLVVVAPAVMTGLFGVLLIVVLTAVTKKKMLYHRLFVRL